MFSLLIQQQGKSYYLQTTNIVLIIHSSMRSLNNDGEDDTDLAQSLEEDSQGIQTGDKRARTDVDEPEGPPPKTPNQSHNPLDKILDKKVGKQAYKLHTLVDIICNIQHKSGCKSSGLI